MVTECFERIADPCFLDCVRPDIHCVTKRLVIEAARKYFHVRRDIRRETTAFTGVDALRDYVLGIVQNAGRGAGIKTDAKRKVFRVNQLKECSKTAVIRL